MIKRTIMFTLVVSCMVAIFCFSAQEAEESSRTSSGFIASFVRFFDLNHSVTEEQISQIIETTENIVRKGAHFSIYAVLGMLVSLLVGDYSICGIKQILLTGALSFLYACSDEIHQHFVKGRSAQLSDIIVDTVGSLCGAAFIAVLILTIQRIKYKRKGV